MYTIKEFALKFNITEHTVRYYTDIGLLPCKRDGANRRVFDDESANWMQGILCLKGCGASLEDIKEYCELCKLSEAKDNLEARYKIILKQKEKAYELLKEAENTVEYLENKAKHYEDILAGKSDDDTNPARWTDITRPLPHN